MGSFSFPSAFEVSWEYVIASFLARTACFYRIGGSLRILWQYFPIKGSIATLRQQFVSRLPQVHKQKLIFNSDEQLYFIWQINFALGKPFSEKLNIVPRSCLLCRGRNRYEITLTSNSFFKKLYDWSDNFFVDIHSEQFSWYANVHEIKTYPPRFLLLMFVNAKIAIPPMAKIKKKWRRLKKLIRIPSLVSYNNSISGINVVPWSGATIICTQ